MLSLKDKNGNLIKKGYNLEDGYRLAYIHEIKGSWYVQYTGDGLVSLTSVTSKHYHKCSNQEQAAKEFREEATAKKNNLERFLKKHGIRNH